LREDRVLPAVNAWLASAFDPERVHRTAKALAAAEADDEAGQVRRDADATEWRRRLQDAEARMVKYEEALVAGLDPAVAARFINQAEEDRRRAEQELAGLTPQEPPTADEIKQLIAELGNTRERLAHADPAVLADTYRALGLRLAWNLRALEVEAEIAPTGVVPGGGR
jgi:site-specific DNA recombinase